MKYKILTSLAVAAATLSPAALAAEPAATLRIDLTGIDLATTRGAEAAERRIDRAVAAFCRNDVEHLSFGARRAARECRESVQRDALAILDSRRAQQLAAR